jgi:hypothetical protein
MVCPSGPTAVPLVDVLPAPEHALVPFKDRLWEVLVAVPVHAHRLAVAEAEDLGHVHSVHQVVGVDVHSKIVVDTRRQLCSSLREKTSGPWGVGAPRGRVTPDTDRRRHAQLTAALKRDAFPSTLHATSSTGCQWCAETAADVGPFRSDLLAPAARCLSRGGVS